jgi:anti-anti-sigma regulatory factor
MYEEREEAIRALTPKSAEMDANTLAVPSPLSFSHLDVARGATVTHVRFKGTGVFPKETEVELLEDLEKLVSVLEINSKVLLDFEDVESFSPACVNALVVFERKLRNRGSRTVLCALASDARASFFGAR